MRRKSEWIEVTKKERTLKMLELPELTHINKQFHSELKGKVIQRGILGNSPHKFVWYNQSHEDFAHISQGKILGESYVKGRWLFVPLEPNYVLLFGEFGGKFHYHNNQKPKSDKYHIWLDFTDNTSLGLTIQMWGFIGLYPKGKENEQQYLKGLRPDPLNSAFTLEYFQQLVGVQQSLGKRSIKGLLTQDQLIPGIGNSTALEIMFSSHLHPKRNIQDLNNDDIQILYASILSTVKEITQKQGRDDETDLLGNKGKYHRIMSSTNAGKPCPVCSTPIQKTQYLGGACIFCPTCQR